MTVQAPDEVEGEVVANTEIQAYTGDSGLAIGASLAELSEEQFQARLRALQAQQERIRQIQRSVMVHGADYGNIGGTDRPTLLKGGAEKLCNLYGLVARIEVEIAYGDNVTSPAINVDAIAYLHVRDFDGPIVAKGRGNANSWEKKYRYVNVRRGLVCPDCSREGVFRTKRGVWWHPEDAKPDGGCGGHFEEDDERLTKQRPSTDRIEDPDPHDKANTLVKMAEKRAHVDATLRGTGTSGLFTQDLEDRLDGDLPAREQTRQARSSRSETHRSGADAPEGSVAWLAKKLTDAKVAPKALQSAIEEIGGGKAGFAELNDEQRKAVASTLAI